MDSSPQVPPPKISADRLPKRDEMQEVFFFERPDGSIIHMTEEAAWNTYSKRQQIIGQYTQPFKFLGSSDGSIYFKALKESQEILKTEGLEAAQRRLKDGLDEELKQAMGNLKPPRNFDTLANNSTKIPVNREGKPI